MNTKQLIILWYGSFILVVFISIAFENYETVILSTGAIAAVVLLYLTFLDSEKINTKEVLQEGVLPIGLILSLILLFIIGEEMLISDHSRRIKAEDIELIDPNLRLEYGSQGSKKVILEGRLRNNSNRTIGHISMRVRIYEYKSDQNNNLPEERITFEELSIIGSYLNSLESSTSKNVGEQIDSDEFYGQHLVVGPGETKSFSFSKNRTHIRTKPVWVWDYEILSVSN